MLGKLLIKLGSTGKLTSGVGAISVFTPKVTDAPFNTLPVCWSNNLPVIV